METTRKARKRLTPHQAEVLQRLERRSAARRPRYTGEILAYKWVEFSQIGSHGALEALRAKGHVERKVEYGPRGGTRLFYRPVSS